VRSARELLEGDNRRRGVVVLGVVAARFGGDDVLLAKATKSSGVSAMRARSASSSALGTLGIVNGRIAVAPEFSIVTDMRISLVGLGSDWWSI